MPLGCRNIEPCKLGAHEVPQDGEVDKKSVLLTIANNAIVGTLLQLSSLVRHADDLFCDLSDECQKVFERTDKLTKRILTLDSAISKLDAKQAVIRKYLHVHINAPYMSCIDAYVRHSCLYTVQVNFNCLVLSRFHC